MDQGMLYANRQTLTKWTGESPPWHGAVETTLFTGGVYDYLLPNADELLVAHPAMRKAISKAKKKNDAAVVNCLHESTVNP